MIDVKNQVCEHDGCSKIPAYNVAGEPRARFCAIHKKPSMIDIKHSRCEHDGCYKIPVYNVAGERRGRFCVVHKVLNMISVKSPTREHDGCARARRLVASRVASGTSPPA